MKALDGLAGCAGSWRGTNTLQDPNSNTPEDSSSSATVTPVLGGKFVRLDYTWSYRGAPQEGSLLIGFDTQADQVTAHWVDTWHMSDKVMACVGPRPDSAILSVRGSYAAPPGPDWGWRIEITPDGRTLRIVMFNIWPDGSREDLAAEASYTRA
jgi:Protein of unknown function (DUF1579)